MMRRKRANEEFKEFKEFKEFEESYGQRIVNN